MCCFSLFVIHIQHLLFWLQVFKKLFHYQLGYFFKKCVYSAGGRNVDDHNVDRPKISERRNGLFS